MFKEPCVIALGMFDCVHIGHKKIIDDCVAYAKQNGVKSVVFTFDKDVASVVNGCGGKNASVYALKERVAVIKSFGADEVLVATADKQFLDKDAKSFLDYLDGFYDIKGYFCGFDYTFGKNAAGNIDYLKSYAKEKGRFVKTQAEVKDEDGKISTSRIKKLLSLGKVDKANAYLPAGYFITGVVEKDRGVGKSIGFPTVNVYPDESKFQLKNAVYAGRIILDKTYRAVINYGARPTFGLDKPLLEAHLIGFNGDLYGKTVTVYFDKFMREIKAFNCVEDLKEQLKKDVGEIDD